MDGSPRPAVERAAGSILARPAAAESSEKETPRMRASPERPVCFKNSLRGMEERLVDDIVIEFLGRERPKYTDFYRILAGRRRGVILQESPILCQNISIVR